MNTYLTPQDIQELKDIKAQYINDADLTDLKKLLKEDNKELTFSRNDNMDITWYSIYDICTTKGTPEYKIFKEIFDNAHAQSPNEKTYILQSTINKHCPKLHKLYEASKNTNFQHAFNMVNERLETMLNESIIFDTEKFILNVDFDFKPYLVDKCEKSLIDNTIAIDKAVSTFFDLLTKGLTLDQRAIVSKNFMQTITYFVSNSTPTAAKEKGNDFKKLVEYVNSQSI